MYFCSEWVVDREGIKYIEDLYEVAADFNCLLWWESFETEEGYVGAKFIIQVPSQSILEDFQKKIKIGKDISDWHTIEVNEREVSQRGIIRLSKLSGNLYSTWMGAFLESAVHNERLRSEITGT